MRTKEAARNTIISLGSYTVILILGFVSQRIFKDVLGQEYLGIHSLFSNIMTMLAVAELGFGTAIVSNMYKPVAENNYDEINALLQLYHKIYRILALVIFSIGMVLLPFINVIVGDDYSIPSNARIVFLFYLTDTVGSYFITYKRSVIYANQKAYYTNTIHTISVTLMNVIQIIILLLTGNYYLYLFARVIFRILENISINILANKMYPYIKTKERYSVDKKIKQSIAKKVKGLIFHRLGTFFVLGSDNIIISMLPNLGLLSVGLYSNYLMILNQINAILTQVFSALTASVGNLLVENDQSKTYKTFKKIQFFNGWIYVVCSVCFCFISIPFVELWMGKEYILPMSVVVALTINMFFRGMRGCYGTFKDAAGIFYEDRFVPLIESAINIIFSVVLGYIFGLVGVFIGTICSNMILFLYSFPKFVYKKILLQNYFSYFKDLKKWILQFAVCFLVSGLIIMLIPVSGVLVKLIVYSVICLIVPNVLLIIMNFKSAEFKYFKEFALGRIRKK